MKKLSIIGIIGTLIWGIVFIIYLLGGFSSSEISLDSISRLLFIMKIIVVGLYLLISASLAFVMFNNEERYLIAFGGIAITAIYCLVYLFVDGDTDFSKGLISFFSVLNSISMIEMFTFSIKSQSAIHYKFQTFLGLLILVVFVMVGFSNTSTSLSLTSLFDDSNKILVILLILCIVGEIINPMLGYLTKDDALDGIVKKVVYQPIQTTQPTQTPMPQSSTNQINSIQQNQVSLTPNNTNTITTPVSPNQMGMANPNNQFSQPLVSQTTIPNGNQPSSEIVQPTPPAPNITKEEVSPQLAFLLEQDETTNKNPNNQ